MLRRSFVSFLLAAAASVLPATAFAQTATIDLSPEQKERPRSAVVADAVKLLPAKPGLAEDGTFSVALTAARLPFGTLATDTKTVVGSEPDIAQLVADSLGLKLKLVVVAWADWPLGLQSGKYDAVISNVTVTEARKEKFDFSTYRKDQLGIYVKKDGPLKAITDPKQVAGLKIIVGASTNQEQILLRWNKQNVEAGLPALETLYIDDDVVADLAIESGRADAYFGPNAIAAFTAARNGKTRLAGTFSGGWPISAEIAVTTRKGAGLADAITAAINAQIANGNYAKALARWNLSTEAVDRSRTNPEGLPKS